LGIIIRRDLRAETAAFGARLSRGGKAGLPNRLKLGLEITGFLCYNIAVR